MNVTLLIQMLMMNRLLNLYSWPICPQGRANLQAGPSNASTLSEVHILENAIDHSVTNQDRHEIHNEVQQANVIDSTTIDMGNSNVIPNEQYLSINNVSVVPSCASSALNDACVLFNNDAYGPHDPIATELKIYKEQVAIYEQRAKFELTEREQRMDDQMCMLIQNCNKTEENHKKELHSVKLQLNSTMENNKIIEETRSYYTKPAFRPKDLKQDVKTFGVQNMTIAGTRAVVNTGKGKMDTDLRKSRWVWRPKGNYLDHVSKDSGSFILKKGNPEILLQDHAVVDSGCSSHMTSNKDYLLNYEDFNGGFVAFRSDPKGDELKFNLFSVSQMCDKKNSVLFTESECLILSPSFKLLDESQVVLRAPRKDDVYNLDLKNIVPSGGKVTPLFDSMLVQQTEDEGKASERPSDSQPIPSPPHPSEDQPQTQTDPSPIPSPSISIPDSNPEGSGGNHGGQSSNDTSLSGNEDGLTLQSVYDLCVSLCQHVNSSG
ncbi:hypothetical protein Tco_0547985 [Tanacetum coccineum]